MWLFHNSCLACRKFLLKTGQLWEHNRKKLYVVVSTPTCLVRCDVDHGIRCRLIAQVRHCIHGQDAERVVGMSHQVEHGHPGLCQPVLTGNESNSCSSRSLHYPSSPGPDTRPCLPSTSASRQWITVLAGPSFPWAFLTQHTVPQVTATPSIQRAIPL